MTAATRVLADLDELATLSDPGPGVTRIAYSVRDAEARRWFAARCAALGLAFELDRHGNCFGWAPGCGERPAVLAGSHLDSVREAGRYDGVLGVVVAFELARIALADDPDAPVAVVAFACEESARFGIGAIGSRLLLGDLDAAARAGLRDLEGVPLDEVLAAAGLDGEGDSRFSPDHVACFVEVHVDQGSGLADAPATVGVVPAIAGSTRTRVTFTGEASHSGAHPRERRRNALLAASRFVVAADDAWAAAAAHEVDATVTVGWLENHPNAANTVAGRTSVVVDVRATRAGDLDALVATLRDAAEAAAAAGGVAVEHDVLGRIAPVAMDAGIVELLLRTAGARGIEHRVLPSMAGHDAEVLGSRIPTAMLFVANPAAVSHSPEEALSTPSLEATIALLRAALPELLAGARRRLPLAHGGAR